MHGAYGLAEIARHIVTVRGNQVRVNLYLGCQADVRLPVGRVRLTHSGLAYPAPGQVRLRVDLRTGADLHLELRLPRTMPLREARLDGTAVANGESPGEVLPLHLDGSGVREIALDFAPAVRSEPCRRPDVFGQRCSLWFGPMPLGTNALPKHVRFSVDPATLAALRPVPASRRGAFPSEVEFSLPAQDAPDFEHTRERRRVVLYPLAANGFRKLSYLNYLF
jgi:hypothetical protein